MWLGLYMCFQNIRIEAKYQNFILFLILYMFSFCIITLKYVIALKQAEKTHPHFSMSINKWFPLFQHRIISMKSSDMVWMLVQTGVRGRRCESPFQGEEQEQQQKQRCSPTAALNRRALIKPTCLSHKAQTQTHNVGLHNRRLSTADVCFFFFF